MRCPRIADLPPPPDGRTGWPWTEDSAQLPDRRPDGPPWPRVSVVTPSYNQGQFVEETIRSVLLQGYPDLEYIIMDGGSTDSSVDIIRKYEPWLSYWISQPDRGQSHAINMGWAKTSGEILAYLNSDDYYYQSAIAAAVEGFLEHPDAGIVYGTAAIVGERGGEIRTWAARPFDVKAMLTEGNIVPQPAAFFSRRSLNAQGYLDERLSMIMDYALCIRVGMQSPTVCLSGKLAGFRDHSDSKTRTRFAATAKELIQFGTAFFADPASGQDLQRLQRATMGRYHFLLALGYASQGRPRSASGLAALFRSIGLNPLFALRRPIHTAYIAKEAVLSYGVIARDRLAGVWREDMARLRQ